MELHILTFLFFICIKTRKLFFCAYFLKKINKTLVDIVGEYISLQAKKPKRGRLNHGYIVHHLYIIINFFIH